MKKSVLDILNDCSPSGRRVSRETLLALRQKGWVVYRVLGSEAVQLRILRKRSYVIEDADRSAKIIFVR